MALLGLRRSPVYMTFILGPGLEIKANLGPSGSLYTKNKVCLVFATSCEHGSQTSRFGELGGNGLSSDTMQVAPQKCPPQGLREQPSSEPQKPRLAQ